MSSNVEGKTIASDLNSKQMDYAWEGASKFQEEPAGKADTTEEDLKLEEIWRETCEQGLVRNDKFVKFCWGCCDLHGHTIADSCSITNLSRLVKSIRIGEIHSLTDLTVNLQIFKTLEQKNQLTNLLVAIAPTITILSMYNIQYRFLSYPINAEFPALKNLELGFNKFKKLGEPRWVIPFVLVFIERAPVLNNLSLKGAKIINQFIEIMKSHNARKVSRLFLSSEMGSQHLVRLATLGLKLKTLCLEIAIKKTEKYPIRAKDMKTFLQSVSANLEELVLQGMQKPEQKLHLELEFPRMAHLKTLAILLYCPFVQFHNLSYVNKLPVLKKLQITLLEPNLSDIFFNANMQPVASLETLALPFPLNSAKLFCIARQFPSLKTLVIDATPSLFENLQESMMNLEELTLMIKSEEGVDADCILTGYSLETCTKLKAELKGPPEVFSEEKKPLPFLQCLKTITLAASGEPLGLTDFGCHLTLLKLAQLQCLNIWGTHEISDRTMKLMQDRFTVDF